jgi:hypothetical protein
MFVTCWMDDRSPEEPLKQHIYCVGCNLPGAILMQSSLDFSNPNLSGNEWL